MLDGCVQCLEAGGSSLVRPPPPFCHRGLFGVDFGLTAPRLRTVAESGMDRCCLGTERAGFSTPHPCPDPGRLSRATPALSGTEVSGTRFAFRGGAVGAPGKGLGEGLPARGASWSRARGGRGLGSLLPPGSLFSRETFFSPSPPVLCEAPTPGSASEPRVRSTGQKPWPHDFRWGGPFGHRSPGYSFLFVKRPGGRGWPA